jgi:hypothetical protein
MAHGPYAQASFEDQFEERTGQNTVEEYSFEVPHDVILTRASCGTKLATAAALDGYILISINNITPVVVAGPPGNRTLKVKTNFLNGIDLPNIPAFKGDKVTVCLILETLNTVHRAKVLIAYACLLERLGIPPDYGYGYAGPHP